MNKRGVTVQSMLIGIIVVLLTAAILFFFFKALPYKETVDKEACRNSVVLRNNVFTGGTEITPALIPLNCKTQEIKISSTNEEFIKREIANAMYDCWWMLGEGKMNFFEKKLERDSYCIICSTIEFDENVQKKLPKIEGFKEYLLTQTIPSKNITYLQYFVGPEIHFTEKNLVMEEIPLLTNKKYAIVYSIVKRDKLIEAFGGSAAGFAASLGIAGGLGALGITIGTGGAALIVIGTTAAAYWAIDKVRDMITNNPNDYWFQFNYVPLEAQYLKDFGCQNIESIP